MGVITLEVGGHAYDDLIAGLDALGEAFEEAINDATVQAGPLLMASLTTVAKKVAEQHSNAWNGQVYNPTDNLQARSGGGLRSILQSLQLVTANNDLVAASISAADLSFHEDGGTIRAKSAQYLTIPLPAALDPRGVPLRERARQWDNTFVGRSKKGNLLIFRRLPKAKDLTPLYILKPSVYVRPRLRMGTTLDTEMGYFESKLFDQISDIIDARLAGA